MAEKKILEGVTKNRGNAEMFTTFRKLWTNTWKYFSSQDIRSSTTKHQSHKQSDITYKISLLRNHSTGNK